MKRFARTVALAAAIWPAAAGAEPMTFLQKWRLYLEHELAVAAQANAPVPPTPIEVSFKTRKLGTLSIGSEVLAVESLDVDGDHRDELIVLTEEAVLVVSPADAMKVTQTAPLPEQPAGIRPRDPVGSLVVRESASGPTLVARSSAREVGASYSLVDGALIPGAEIAGYPLCAAGSMELATGRDYYVASGVEWPDESSRPRFPAEFYAAHCHPFTDSAGYRAEALAVVSVDRVLSVSCRRLRDGTECSHGPASGRDYEGSGVAHLVVDLDRDGVAEVVTTQGGPPGQADRVSVFSHKRKGRLYSRGFSAGVVALTAADLQGQGALSLVAAVRQLGTGQVTFWRLN
jgi:hypothetical protein